MKEHEIYSDIKVPLSSDLILRLDGRNFHSLSKKLNLKTPFDREFTMMMVKACLNIFKEFSPSFVYTFSDEVNILFNSIPFSGRLEKLNSVFSSLVSSSLTLSIEQYRKDFDKTYDGFMWQFKDSDDLFPIAFDSRVILVSNDGVFNYFKWRQDEAYRNCINSYGYWALKEDCDNDELKKKSHGFKSSDIHEYLFKNKGINLGKLPNWQRRGIAIYKKDKINISFDEQLPKFNKDFFNRIL
ncbi:MAG: guanylyltransferase [Methanobrevibacter sp.]|nr:guanylyltransferase [Candidatus Methanovirga basalitermitum]